MNTPFPSPVLRHGLILALAVALLLSILPATADPAPKAIPSLIHYQGVLSDPATGAPREGAFTITFALYETKTADTALWTETKTITVSGGLLQTHLGNSAVLPKDIFTNGSLWLGIAVAPDPEATPRQRLTPVPFAINSTYLGGKASSDYAPAAHEHDAAALTAGTLGEDRIPPLIARDAEVFGIIADADGAGSGLDADYLDGFDSGAFSQVGHNHDGVYLRVMGPQVMSGDSDTPILLVQQTSTGPAGRYESGSGYGLAGESASNFGLYGHSGGTFGVMGEGTSGGVMGASATAGSDAVFGLNTATTSASWGIRGESRSPDGRGVSGYNAADTGSACGVFGGTNSPTGIGVIGSTTAGSGASIGVQGITGSTTGTGVQGQAMAATGSGTGVHGTSTGPNGAGVMGNAYSADGSASGVIGQSAAEYGAGVHGVATHSSGAAHGVLGENYSPAGTAVSGHNFSATGTSSAVNGSSDSIHGVGVRGASSYVGVWGVASGDTGLKWAVYGYCGSPAGYAGYFSGDGKVTGDLEVDGTLTKSAGTFKIDHPLDPENKYLYHSFVESPDMMNVYNGNIFLDSSGEATVELPPYFEALNRDFRYQLTPIGGAAPNLHVAQKVNTNQFRIAGGTPGLEVSWQVTGIRQDPYAKDHPVEVEQSKPAAERGAYLYPEGYGQPPEKGLDQALSPDAPK